MFLGACQIHIQAVELLKQSTMFLEAVHRFRDSLSLAPNFLLATLKRALRDPDLSCLRLVNSGGESNSVGISVKLLDRRLPWPVDYEPLDFLPHLDVFVVGPIMGAAQDRQEYFGPQMMRW